MKGNRGWRSIGGDGFSRFPAVWGLPRYGRQHTVYLFLSRFPLTFTILYYINYYLRTLLGPLYIISLEMANRTHYPSTCHKIAYNKGSTETV